MKRILIVDVETIVGGNLASALSHHHHVAGLSSNEDVAVAGCDMRSGMPETPEDIRRELAVISPDLVVLAGPAAIPLWSLSDQTEFDADGLAATARWARIVAETEAKLIAVSSDAVFHGPWMFHEEDAGGGCDSAPAKAIRTMEMQVLRHCPSALVLRTNVFGWSPLSQSGWLENLLEQIAEGSPVTVPAANYATPIEASRFAELLIQAWDRGLEGLYHIGGSERVNFVHFAHRLAQEFQLPRPRFERRPRTASGFGQGETSLNSGRFRRAVGAALPMLGECLTRLRDQSETGDRLHAEERESLSHAA